VSDAPCGPGIFPVQLLEALMLFALAFCALVLLLKKKELPFFLLYLIFYSVIRFALEYLRNDKGRGFIGPLSVSQFISIFVFIISLTIVMLNLIQHLKRMHS
jgi:phosphatidylglycerol:prolipoprotein diacylglycerol transferase